MKILHLLQSTKYSGAENVACQIIKLLSSDKEFDMVYVCQKGAIEKQLLEMDIPFYLLDSFSLSEVRKAIKEIKPDLIHAHDFNASTKAAMCCCEPIVSQLHNNPTWIKKVNIKTIAYALAAWKIKKIIGVSYAVRDEYVFKKYIINKYEVISNVIDAETIVRLSDADVNDVEYSDLLFVGRLTTQKNPLAFIRIVEIIKHEFPNIKSIMIGEGKFEEDCKNYIQSYALSENIKMIGFTDNPYRYMKRTKILVVPSIFEGFGLVAIEAMTLGVPVIASDVGGLHEIIAGGTGFLCSTEDDFVSKTKELLRNEEMRNNYGEEAKKQARMYSDVNQYRDRWKKIYYEALNGMGVNNGQ